MKNRDKRLQIMKQWVLRILKWLVLLSVTYVILSPLVVVVTNSFFTAKDVYSPIVSLIPRDGTLQNYVVSYKRMVFGSTFSHTLIYVFALTVIQLFICSMVGYGFARFEFRLKKVMFSCVILSIVLPAHSIMLPLYMRFRDFDIFGILKAVRGEGVNLLGTQVPMYIMTIFGNGLKSGLYIYIFNQFFRGLPKEIEEAACVDGAGALYTYFRIMLVNAMPAILTCTVFSMVWQYNDSFYANLFSISSKYLISLKIGTLRSSIEYLDKIQDSALTQIYVYAGVTMVMAPIILAYLFLQKYFIEGVERSGIVG